MRPRTWRSPAVASRGRQTAVDDGEAERDPAAADKVPVGQAQAPALAAKLRRGDVAEREANLTRAAAIDALAAIFVNHSKALTAIPMKKNEPSHMSGGGGGWPLSVAVIAPRA
jgi:hypothetical protein